MKTLITIALLIVTLIISGCGSGVNVGGKITFEDGTPLTKGTVIFENAKANYRGVIKKDGSYALGITNDGQKIEPGEYKVWFADTSSSESYRAQHYTLLFFTVSEECTSVRTTPLTAAVESGSNKTYDFTVKRAEPATVKVLENGKREAVKESGSPPSGTKQQQKKD